MNWDKIAKDAADALSAVAPVLDAAVEALAPGAAQVFHLVERIAQGVIAAEPTAVALYDRIKNGEVPSGDELQQFSKDYEASYQRLKAALSA